MTCTCDPRHLDIGGTDRDCPVHGETTIETLADLLSGTKELIPYVGGEDIGFYCGKAGRIVTHHVRVGNHNDPKRTLHVFCTTYGCMQDIKVSALPKRYRVTEAEFEHAAARFVRSLVARRNSVQA